MGRRRRSGRSGGGLFGSKSKSKSSSRSTRRSSSSRAKSPLRRRSKAPATTQSSKRSNTKSQSTQKQQSKAPTTQQQPAAQAPATQQRSGGMLSGLASTVMQGMAFGTGSAIAHRAIDSVAGPREVSVRGEDGELMEEEKYDSEARDYSTEEDYSVAEPEHRAESNNTTKCLPFRTQFLQCIEAYPDNVGSCQKYMDSFKVCQQNFALELE